ncbi:MAG: hypothetical protein K9M07_05550 [Simkaniaceae bacterium]|nr:hypothetical protein [Simkaniaceae bacterium]
MVEHIEFQSRLPEDFGVSDNTELSSKIHQYVEEHAQNLYTLKTAFQTEFSQSNPLFKRLFQQLMFGLVDHLTDNVHLFIDENAHSHSLLPHDIDHLIYETQNFLKNYAMLLPSSEQKSSKYRATPHSQTEQKNEDPTTVHAQTEASFSKQLQVMLAQVFSPSDEKGLSPMQPLTAKELQIAHLCSDFFSTSCPLEQGEIYTKIQKTLQTD